MSRSQRNKGFALLSAMITVTIVAAISASAFWVRWRSAEVEIADQGRHQISWLIRGALAWSRLILLEDAKANALKPVDHLGEPWAIELSASKISTFVSYDQKQLEGDPEVFLSGKIVDEQGMLNIKNLVQNDRVDPEMFAIFSRLFDSVGVDNSELMTVIERLGDADQLSPLSDRELGWLGLSEDSLKKLQGLVTWLPSVTPVNVNTAPSLVLSALFPGLQPGQVSEIVLQRTREAWQSLDDFSTKVGPAVSQISSGKISFRSDYFRVVGRISTGNSFQTEEALMRRDGNIVEILWLRHDANK